MIKRKTKFELHNRIFPNMKVELKCFFSPAPLDYPYNCTILAIPSKDESLYCAEQEHQTEMTKEELQEILNTILERGS